jgi:predicted regulator of Ras-like GTPase activity (Roadblock/LC7/MglB family)
MMNPDHIVLFGADSQRLKSILSLIQKDLRAQVVLLINRGGHQIACVGPARELDLTSLASLAAANLAATEGLAHLVGEPSFSVLHHQGTDRSIHISSLGDRFALILVFYEPIAVGIVRWKLKRATTALEEVFRSFISREESAQMDNIAESSPSLFSDEEIERLLGS